MTDTNERNKSMTPEELTKHLEAHEYRFAKTMPQIPHYYTLRKNWKDDKLFEEVVQAIRDLGEVRPWPAPPKKARYHHTYFDAGEWSYWSMGAPLNETILINRAKTYHPTTAKPVEKEPEQAAPMEPELVDEEKTGDPETGPQDLTPLAPAVEDESQPVADLEAPPIEHPESQGETSATEPTKPDDSVRSNGSLHIIRLQAENFKKLRAVEITPKGNVVTITGRNGAGKSSVLDSIFAALGGRNAAPKKPIREGEKRSRVVADLGDLVATQVFTPSGSRLEVANKDGMVFKSPQAVLDKLVGAIGFDPLAFMAMDDKAKRQVLIELMGVDVTAHDKKIADLKNDRSTLMEKKKEAAKELEAMPQWPEAPEEEVSVTELMAELKQANETNKALETLEKQADADLKELTRLSEEFRALQVKIATAQQAAQTSQAALKDKSKVDTEAIEQRAEKLETTNKQVRENQARTKKEAEIEELGNQVYTKYQAIQAAEAEKANALAEVKLPLEGLSVDEEGVTFDGIPLSQVNHAKQVEVSMAIGMAQNPKLRVMLANGNGLDSETLATVARLAQENDYQVWLEVADESGKMGIVIEDGTVASVN